jgi:hypothetical protein
MTPEDLNNAKVFLDAVHRALENAEGINKATNEWTRQEGELYNTAPPLLKQSVSWLEAVDPDTFKKFNLLVDFMRDALFGVDCDNDSAVRFATVDMAREENFLPTCTVKRVDYDDPLIDRHRQIELMELNIASLQERLRGTKRCFDEDLKKKLRADERIRKAKGCETCQGKGWVKTTFEVWSALDYGAKCRTADIGCDFRLKEDRRGAKYRLFCSCQTKDDDK